MSLASASERIREYSTAKGRHALTAILFGDRFGLLAFFGSLCLFGLVWQTAVFITDSYALLNGLYSFSNGNVFMTEAAYGPSLDTPGAVQAPGGRIARNYGAIVPALVFWALLEALTLVADLRVALVGLWSLALLGFVVTLGRVRDDERIALAGAIGVLALFALNVALAHPLDSTATHLYALQLFHITVAAFAPVLCYRLLTRLDSRRLALAATTVLVFGTPLILWATIAKRHAITATAILAVVYALYRSRTDADETVIRHRTTFRALAYGVVGLYAWVHAPEALLMLVVLVTVDVPTAADNSPRTLAYVGSVFVVSLIPFFLTNLVLTGSPMRPPRLWAVQGAESIDPLGAAETADGGGSANTTQTQGGVETTQGGNGGETIDTASGTETTEPAGGAETTKTADNIDPNESAGGPGGSADWPPKPLTRLLAMVGIALESLWLLASQITQGLGVLSTNSGALWQTLVRSGDAAAALNNAGTESVNLSLLESAPVLAALVGGLPVTWRRLRARTAITRRIRPETVVDLFALLLCATLVLQYASRLPVHAQLTVRYLFPLFPLGVYLLARLPVVRATLTENWRLFIWTTAVTILVGGQLLAVAVFWTAVGLGEAFQLHALLALGTATPLAAWSLLGRSDDRFGHAGAVLLGVATGLSTVFVLLVALEYYSIGDSHLLPMVRVVAEQVDLL